MRLFELLEPESVNEALSLLAKHKGEAKLIAGGQSLLPFLKQRFIAPEYLINIKDLKELSYIKREKDRLVIGALTTERAIEKEPELRKDFPILADMESVLASVQIRNWGTIGGSLALSDPAGDPAPVLIALDATVKAASVRGEREIALEKFQTGYLQTVLEEDEMLTEVSIPYPVGNAAGAYATSCARAGDLGVVNVAAQVSLGTDGRIDDARIVLGAQSRPAFRAREAEVAAIGKGAEDDLRDVAAAAAKDARPQADLAGSVEYKRELAGVLTKRALALAISRVQAA